MLENTITITVPWLPILVVVGVMIATVVIRGQVRRVNALCLQRRQKIQDEFKSLFPSPWDEAHEELRRFSLFCHNRDANARARTFLRHWLSEQKNLPRLSREAVLKIANLLTFKYSDRWDECLQILDPYTDEIQSLEKSNRLAGEQSTFFHLATGSAGSHKLLCNFEGKDLIRVGNCLRSNSSFNESDVTCPQCLEMMSRAGIRG